MAKSKSKGSPPRPPKQSIRPNAEARVTVGGPARPSTDPDTVDNLEAKVAGTQELVASIPFNANKRLEYARRAAVRPEAGRAVEPHDPMVTASTVTGVDASDRVGSGAPSIATDKTIGTLDRMRVDSADRPLTTNQGVPVADNQSSHKAGLRGPTVPEDLILLEKITHFKHERIPDRIVHARGSAAQGYLECYESLERYTRASLFAEASRRPCLSGSRPCSASADPPTPRGCPRIRGEVLYGRGQLGPLVTAFPSSSSRTR